MAKSQFSPVVQAVRLILALIGGLFLIRVVDALLGLGLNLLGIVPRTVHGLVGIVFAPLLHANLNHLTANAVPLFVLLILLLSNREYHPYRALAWIWLASGLGTWLIGRGQAVHLGASSVIFGLAAFLIVAGFSARSWRAALIAILVFFLYGGIFYGVLPQAGPISWEGHFCGMVAGAWTARKTLR